MLFLFLIMLASIETHSYQLFQAPKIIHLHQYAKNITAVIPSPEGNRFITIYQSINQLTIFYAIIKSQNDVTYSISRTIKKIGYFEDAYWSSLQILILVFNNGLCYEFIPNLVDGQLNQGQVYQDFCMDNLVKEEGIITSSLQEEEDGQVYLFALVQSGFFIRYSINVEGIIQKINNFTVGLLTPKNTIFKLAEYQCFIVQALATNNLNCFDFTMLKQFTKSIGPKFDKVGILQNEQILFLYKQPFSMQKVAFSQDRQTINLEYLSSSFLNNGQNCLGSVIFGNYLFLINQDWSNKTHFGLYYRFKQTFKQYEHIPFIQSDSLSFLLSNQDKIILICSISSTTKLVIVDRVSYIYLNYIIPFMFLVVLLVIARFSLFKVIQKIREYPMTMQWSILIGQTLMILLLYAFLIIVMAGNNIQQHILIKDTDEITAVGSYFSRMLYYIFLFNSVVFVLCELHINNVFKNKKLNMLKKHGLIFSFHISIRAFSIIFKSMLYALFALSFIYITEKIHLQQQQRAFTSYIKIINIWSAYTVCLSNLVIFSISLNLIISSFWYSTQINLLIIYFTVTYTEHLVEYKTNTVLQNFLILLAPITNFYTILQAILQTQFRYALISKSTNLIYVFIIILSDMVAFSLFYTVYIIYSYKKFDLQNIIKTNKKDSLLQQKNIQLENSFSILDEVQREPFLSVFIPCKFNMYNGFEKATILQDIRFTANRNEIITFIDYKNISKYNLFKILINDQKSDSFIEKNEQGQIVYSQNIKLSYCLDNNYHYQQLNAYEHLELFLRLKIKSISKEELKKTILTMLNQFNIPQEQATKKSKYLSGGYLKKMSLACVFIGDPDVIIVDEPTLGLDIRFKRIFWQKIKKLKANRLIIIGTSDSEQAQAISDKIWILQRSKMIDYAVYKRKKLMISFTFSFFSLTQFQQAKIIINYMLDQGVVVQEETRISQFIISLLIYTIQDKVCTILINLINKLKDNFNNRYYFSFKIVQNKFHSHQYSKYYNSKCNHCNRQQILQMIHNDLNDIYELDQILYRERNSNIFKKNAEQFLQLLSKQQKRQNNLNLSQLKAIIYQRIILIKNKQLYKRQLFFATLYFWLITFYYFINRQQSTYSRWIAFVKLIVIYEFLHIKMIYTPLQNQGNKKYLLTIGLNIRCYWIGNWIVNLLYLFVPIVVNIVIWFIIQYTIFMQVQLNIFLCIIGTFFYTVNFIITILFFSSLTSNYAITFIILSIINVFPLLISKDIYLIRYDQYNFEIFQLIKYLYYPISFTHFISEQNGSNQWGYIYIMAYEYLITLLIFLLIQAIQSNQFHGESINVNQYVNVSNQSIRKEQISIDNIVDQKKFVYGQNIIKRYKKNIVLQNIYFSIKEGEVFGFLGHNGSGKTTLFKIITNMINSTAGSIHFFGEQNQKMSYQHRLKVGYCPQFYKLYGDMTLEQNVRFIGMLKGLEGSYIAKYITLFFQYFRMKGNEKTFIKHLTEGQRRKFSIIISFLGFPKLLLFDETTTGIDTQSRIKSINLIKTYCTLFNSAALITSHNISEAQHLCDRVCILKQGKILRSGTPFQLKKMASQQFYKLIINFKTQQNILVLNKKIQIIKEYIRSLRYVNVSLEEGCKVIYSLDMVMINIEAVLQSLVTYFKDGVVQKFSLYKHDLEEVVKYAMSDQSELAETQNNSEAGDKNIQFE